MINSISSPSPLPTGQEGGLKVGVVERGLLRITKGVPLTSMTQEIPRLLGALCQKPEVKTKYVFLVISQYHNPVPQDPDSSCVFYFHWFIMTFNSFSALISIFGGGLD